MSNRAERRARKLENRFAPQTPGKPGPATPEGLAISSRNALKHGSCSTATLILPNESKADFDALERRWFQAYKPTSELESELIRNAIRADWFFQRADRNSCDVEAAIYAQNPDPFTWDDDIHKKQRLFLRYRTTQANLLAKARKAVEDHRKARLHEAIKSPKPADPVDKAKPQPKANPKREYGWQYNIQEDIAELKQQAIDLGYLTPDGKPTGKRL